MLANPEAATSPQQPVLVAEIKQLYLANGGVEAKWLDWATGAPKTETTAPSGLEYSILLPAFEARDFSGKTWSLADEEGKATFVDVWATWCGPCRAEHPELQKLYDRIKDRKDIQVLTFSIDESAYAAESYMRGQTYSIPVIAGNRRNGRPDRSFAGTVDSGPALRSGLAFGHLARFRGHPELLRANGDSPNGGGVSSPGSRLGLPAQVNQPGALPRSTGKPVGVFVGQPFGPAPQ